MFDEDQDVMGKFSLDKGKRFERELVHIFSGAVPNARISRGFQYRAGAETQLCVMRKLLNTAVEWKLMDTAPTIRPLKAQKPEIRFLGFEEVARLMEATEEDWRDMVITALNTGLRLGELLALRWQHVDLKLGQLVVCENDWRGIIGTPKGNKARVIPLNNVVLAALRDHRPARGPLVFCRKDGSRLTYQQCRRPLIRMCRRAEIEPLQWHSLRHTFATQMAMRGVPLKTIQDLLGHVTIEMTMRYAHNTPEASRAAVAILEGTDAGHGTLMAHRDLSQKNTNNIN